MIITTRYNYLEKSIPVHVSIIADGTSVSTSLCTQKLEVHVSVTAF